MRRKQGETWRNTNRLSQGSEPREVGLRTKRGLDGRPLWKEKRREVGDGATWESNWGTGVPEWNGPRGWVDLERDWGTKEWETCSCFKKQWSRNHSYLQPHPSRLLFSRLSSINPPPYPDQPEPLPTPPRISSTRTLILSTSRRVLFVLKITVGFSKLRVKVGW